MRVSVFSLQDHGFCCGKHDTLISCGCNYRGWCFFTWFWTCPSSRTWLQTRTQAWSFVRFYRLILSFALVLLVFHFQLRVCRVISNFSLSFSVISVLTGVTTLYNTGLNYGGPVSMQYGWFIASAFTMLVALSMAEICSSYPTTGGLYYWSAKLAGPRWAPFASWITGWYSILNHITNYSLFIL